MKLNMPGCLFDPGNIDLGQSFFRSCAEIGGKVSFYWIRLSPTHHTQYLEGFKAAWPPDPAKMRVAVRSILKAAVISGILLCGVAWIVLTTVHSDPKRELVWSLLVGCVLWMCILWVAAWHHRIALIRRAPWFRVFETMLGVLTAGLLLGVLVNVLSSWLVQ